MADLPRILARPELPTVNLPRQDAGAMGRPFAELAQAAGEWQQALKQQKEAQDLLTLQKAVDDRDELYRQNALAAQLNPDVTGKLTADQFLAQFKDQAKKDDAAVLQDLPAQVKPHAQLHFARLQKTAFDAQFNQYRSMFIDQAQGQLITQRDDKIQKIAQTDDPALKEEYTNQLNGLLQGAQAAGIFKAEQIANMKREVNNDVEVKQANLQMLNKAAGGPQQVLADMAANKYPNIKRPDEIIANATRLAKQNEAEAEKKLHADQDKTFRALSMLVENGQSSGPEIRSLEESNSIRSEQARHLMGILGAPTYAVSPGAVNQIMNDRAKAGLSLSSNAAARQQILKLDPRDPHVTGALNLLNNSDKALQSHANAGGQITQALREFRDMQYSPNSNKSVMQHFLGEGMRTQSPKYYNAMNHLATQIGQGVPKDKAMKEALEMVRPKAGAGAATPGQKVTEYIGE